VSSGDEQVLRTDATLDKLHEARAFIDRAGRALGATESALADLRLAVDEAVTNVAVHGYRNRGGPLEIAMAADGADLRITIRDRAPAFDAEGVPDPQLDTDLAERPFGGMGVFLIGRMTDGHEYRARPGGGNELVLVKKNAIP